GGVGGWMGGGDGGDVVAGFLDAGMPAAPVNDLPAIVEDPHIRERGSLVRVDDELGPLTMPAPTPRLGATPARVRATGPRLGAHNEEVFRDWLDFDPAEGVELRRAGVV